MFINFKRLGSVRVNIFLIGLQAIIRTVEKYPWDDHVEVCLSTWNVMDKDHRRITKLNRSEILYYLDPIEVIIVT